MTTPTRLAALAVLGLPLAACAVRADERLEGIACRSVHLGYPAPAGAAFYNEVAVDRSAPGTYFCVCGFNQGYYGLQELGNGKKLLIFSVWDPTRGDNPKAVPEEKRVKLLYKDDKVRTGRFGGEGTGGQSFFDYDWKTGQTYRFLVTARADDARTAYAAHFFVPEDGAWKHLVTFSTPAQGKAAPGRLGGYYSFVEDFKRDRVSATRQRQAHFGNGWVRTLEETWQPLTRARFTADANPVKNINAGPDGDRFFLTTGGDTRNTDTPLNQTMQRKAAPDARPPRTPQVTGPHPRPIRVARARPRPPPIRPITRRTPPPR